MHRSRGDIWFVDLTDARGHEQSGLRPAVVLAVSHGGMTVVVPLTTTPAAFSFPHTHGIEKSLGNGFYAGIRRQTVSLNRDTCAIHAGRPRYLIKHSKKLCSPDRTTGGRRESARLAESGSPEIRLTKRVPSQGRILQYKQVFRSGSSSRSRFSSERAIRPHT